MSAAAAIADLEAEVIRLKDRDRWHVAQLAELMGMVRDVDSRARTLEAREFLEPADLDDLQETVASLRRSVGGAKDTLRAEAEKVRRDRGFLVRELSRALERFRQLESDLGELREFNILEDRRDDRQPDPLDTPGRREGDPVPGQGTLGGANEEPFGQSVMERELERQEEKEREARRLERAQTATATVERLDCIVLEDGRRIASFDLGTEEAARSFAVSCQREFPTSRFEVARIIGRVVTREELEVQP